MAGFSEDFLKKTIEFWQPHYGHALSIEDAREIATNMTDLFEFLNLLDKKYSDATTEGKT
jgi:hypothetical protein